MDTVLVVASETIGARALHDAIRARAAEGNVRFVLCVPQKKPSEGLVIYDDAVHDAAQARVDLALGVVRANGIDAIGEVGDFDAYSATMDAVREYHPDEIIISTYPAARSGWLRSDLVERIKAATRLPVTHIECDVDHEGLPFYITLAVANRTASGDELLEALKAKAAEPTPGKERGHVFIVLVPQEGGDGHAARRARARLRLVRDRMRQAGLITAGMVGDPDPYTAIMNALQVFRIDDIIISTFEDTKSGWLRADLIERVRRTSNKPVDHVVHADPATTAAAR